jgi:hypothetical protein
MEERVCFHVDALIDKIHSCTSFQEIFSLKNAILAPKEKDYKIFFAYDKGEVLFKGTESEFIEFSENNKDKEFIYDSKFDEKAYIADKFVYTKFCMNFADKIGDLIIERLLTAHELTEQDAKCLRNYTIKFFADKGIPVAECLEEYVDKVFEYANFLIKFKTTKIWH